MRNNRAQQQPFGMALKLNGYGGLRKAIKEMGSFEDVLALGRKLQGDKNLHVLVFGGDEILVSAKDPCYAGRIERECGFGDIYETIAEVKAKITKSQKDRSAEIKALENAQTFMDERMPQLEQAGISLTIKEPEREAPVPLSNFIYSPYYSWKV